MELLFALMIILLHLIRESQRSFDSLLEDRWEIIILEDVPQGELISALEFMGLNL